MPTPKSLREAPSRIFENYILTLEVDSRIGLSKVSQESFLQIPGPAGDGGTLDTESSPLDIGFPFSFDGIIYKKFVVSTNGFLVLLDPTTVSLDLNTVFGSGVDYENSNIKQTFGANHSLLTPWFDGSLRNLYSDQSSSGLSLSPRVIDSYQKGISQPSVRVNPRKFGIQFFNELSSNSGRKLIVRWNSSSNGFSGDSPANTLCFEVIIFENGKIEFRYSPASNFADQDYDTYGGATIGIFMPLENRFRDFSYELGYRKNDRERYKFGGTIYDPSYTDGDTEYTANYSVNLNPVLYWPGQKNSGAVFTFQPPLNRRRILPRASLRERDSRLTLPTVARTGDSRGGNSISTFDDRHSIAYKRDIVNYPTTIPRFYGENGLGLADRQNLFSGEFFLTGNVVKSLIQDFIGNDPQQYVAPFVENKLFENDPGSDVDSFYTVGSSVNDVGEGFKQPLKSKTQIRLSMRVDHKTRMFEASSSIYYYNSLTKRWQYPTASFQNGAYDIADPIMDVTNDRLIEVDRGFNTFGFNIASGSASSTNRSTGNKGTDAIVNAGWTKVNETYAISKTYSKSVQNNECYAANQDESFTLPINQPFLIEKAVIDLPIEAGPGWFEDTTQCFIPITATSPSQLRNLFDVGGPALTVALYNQVSLGRNTFRRDLVLSGTITHQIDDKAEIIYSNSPDIGNPTYSGIWQVRPNGFRAYGGAPTAVVTGSLKKIFVTTEINYEPAGAEQTFTVPDGITSLNVKMWGAGGGAGGRNVGSTACGTDNGGYGGGAGGFTSGTISVTPGETIKIIVGEGGYGTTCKPVGLGGIGGFGGGGTGTSTADVNGGAGGGGGGYSGVFTNSVSFANALLIAGGGGGGTGIAAGGGGGGLTGSNGTTKSSGVFPYPYPASIGGQGGTQLMGGNASDGSNGAPSGGSQLQGGDGIPGTGGIIVTSVGGGGGGGGYYGGGGGGNSGNHQGGGGGSGYLHPSRVISGGATETGHMGSWIIGEFAVAQSLPPNTSDLDWAFSEPGIGGNNNIDNGVGTNGNDGLVKISYGKIEEVPGTYFFTGSVGLKCQASISNGALVRDAFYLTQNRLDYVTGALETIFNTPSWNLSGRGNTERFNTYSGGGYRYRNIISVNNLGRGGTGFEPSGRSILGKEFTTAATQIQGYDNPFYLYKDENTLSDLAHRARYGTYNTIYLMSTISRQENKPSPYLVFPGDKLILSVSKSRPHFFSNQVSKPYTSGSIQHDIKLTTGSINITLYGSLVSNGQEFHDTLNQPLASDAIHEVVVGETKTW